MTAWRDMDRQATPREPGSPRRSFIALAFGALVGLGLAGYGLFSAPSGGHAGLPPDAVARVNDGLILAADFRAQTEALYDTAFDRSTAAQRKEVLDSMVAEELLVQRGLEIGMPATSAEVREALVAAVNRQSATDAEAHPPTEQQLRDYHARHPERYVTVGTMTVAELSVPLSGAMSAEAALGVARRAAQDLRAGAPLAHTLVKYALRANPNVGREAQIDVAVARFLGPVLFAEAGKLKAGGVSDPVLAEDGAHLLYCTSRSPAVAQDFATTRERVLADFTRETSLRLQKEYVRFLRDKANVVVGAP
ncbi:MAG: peptidylprolyl isomerase [Pseudomonadota bacterium]